MYELIGTFFFNCHTYTLASEPQLEQPSWLNNPGQFSQKKVWLVVGIMRHGAEVEVLEPPELRDKVIKETTKLLKQYKKASYK